MITAEWEPSGDLNQLLHSSWFGIVCFGIFCISYNGNHWPHFSTCCTRRVLDCFEMFGIHLKYFTVESIWSILKCIFRKCNDTVCGNHLVTSTNPNLSWIHFGSHSLCGITLTLLHAFYILKTIKLWIWNNDAKLHQNSAIENVDTTTSSFNRRASEPEARVMSSTKVSWIILVMIQLLLSIMITMMVMCHNAW